MATGYAPLPPSPPLKPLSPLPLGPEPEKLDPPELLLLLDDELDETAESDPAVLESLCVQAPSAR
jgi:hypothetical protein